MRRYFYGIKVQLLVSKSGIPIRFCFVPGKQADAKGFERMIYNLPPESQIFADSAYTNYETEDLFKHQYDIFLQDSEHFLVKTVNRAIQKENK